MRSVLLSLSCLLALLISGCGSPEPPPTKQVEVVTDEHLINAAEDTANWITYGGTFQEQRYSPLDQINENNLDQLGLVWSKELGTYRGLEATPIVWQGVLYFTTTWSVVHAVDARTGKTLWWYDPQVPRSYARFACCDVVNRGVAIYEGKIFVGTIDGRLLALDTEKGELVWETLTVDPEKAYTITGAPRVFDGKVLIGNGGAEYGVRGYVSAYDTDTGDMLWRTYTVPGDPALGFESEALEMAAETWNGEWWTAGGGGTAWDAIVYDPELNLVYVGTGNGAPWAREVRSPGGGDNLFLSSILALNPDDGSYVWHYQTTPGDNWDYTATQPMILAELEIEGRLRKVLLQAPKNGFFYVLDRETGELISANNYVKITWATGFDSETGRPIESPHARSGTEPVLVSPEPAGAHNWHPMAFHPDTGLVYIPAKENDFFLFAYEQNPVQHPLMRFEGLDVRYEGPLQDQWRAMSLPEGALIAWDPIEQKEVWRAQHPLKPSGGTLATGGNLVFQGRGDGILLAYRATDGEILWQFDAETGIMAPPVTYELDGTQYLTLLVGWGGAMGLINPPSLGTPKAGWGRLLNFALNGSASISAAPFGYSEPPVPVIEMDSTPEMIKEGGILYGQLCLMCHGVNAVGGALPDLRYSTAEVHAQFESIVLEGAREPLGMPHFKGLLTPEQLKMIQAYILAQAKAASEN